MSNAETEILAINAKLLTAIAEGNWEVYAELCDANLTAFEPEAAGHLVAGLDFHRFYFTQPKSEPDCDAFGNAMSRNDTMASPKVWLLGDNVAVIAYVRLTQKTDMMGESTTTQCEETRVWRRVEGRWRHIHFHRSHNAR